MKSEQLLDIVLRELEIMWGFGTAELADIREKMIEYGQSMESQGFQDQSPMSFLYGSTYGKKSDND